MSSSQQLYTRVFTKLETLHPMTTFWRISKQVTVRGQDILNHAREHDNRWQSASRLPISESSLYR